MQFLLNASYCPRSNTARFPEALLSPSAPGPSLNSGCVWRETLMNSLKPPVPESQPCAVELYPSGKSLSAQFPFSSWKLQFFRVSWPEGGSDCKGLS